MQYSSIKYAKYKLILKHRESYVINYKLTGFDQKVTALTNKVDAITGVYEDINEKMFEIDKTRKNNLLFYGIRPDFLPEIQTQLEKKVHEILRFNLNISRNVPIVKIARMMTGPEVRGCRPVLVNFAYWKDREEVFSKSKFLRGSNIYITEDLSRRLRETRHRLTQYMRDVSDVNHFWHVYIHFYYVIFDHFFIYFIFLILNRFEQDLPIKDALYATTNFILIIRHIIIMRKQEQ